MKIIFVISALHGGGAERVVATLANSFAAHGDEVTILMTAGDETIYKLHPNVRALSVGQASHGDLRVQAGRLLRMRSYFKSHKDSYIVSFSTTINLFTIIAALGLPNRVIVSERNDPNRCRYRVLRDLIYSFGKGFVFQTEDARDCFPQRIRKKSVVIPNPIRKELPAPCTGAREKKIAAVGRLEPQKNHRLLLDAFAGFHKKHPEWELHIFGKGRLEGQLKERTKELQIDKYVIFEGFQDRILETIRTYGMYVLSSDYEGIPNSLLEAMALGIPCISTDCPIGGCAMCVRDGINGLLTPTGDKEALQRAMERLAASYGQEAGEMGRQAVKVRETFAEEKIAGRWRDFIGKNGNTG